MRPKLRAGCDEIVSKFTEIRDRCEKDEEYCTTKRMWPKRTPTNLSELAESHTPSSEAMDSQSQLTTVKENPDSQVDIDSEVSLAVAGPVAAEETEDQDIPRYNGEQRALHSRDKVKPALPTTSAMKHRRQDSEGSQLSSSPTKTVERQKVAFAGDGSNHRREEIMGIETDQEDVSREPQQTEYLSGENAMSPLRRTSTNLRRISVANEPPLFSEESSATLNDNTDVGLTLSNTKSTTALLPVELLETVSGPVHEVSQPRRQSSDETRLPLKERRSIDRSNQVQQQPVSEQALGRRPKEQSIVELVGLLCTKICCCL